MNDEVNPMKLMSKTINAIRDLAISVESDDIKMAEELMLIAHKAAPHRAFLKKKLNSYRDKDISSVSEKVLREKIESGKVAIIPVGFRCYTKINLYKTLNISQPSLPFDYGFFPPCSVISVLKNPVIDMKYPDEGATHSVCIKHENYRDADKGLGIKFEKSNYNEINAIVASEDVKGINKFLDSTKGYYTLDTHHKFVLAHYNWHPLAKKSLSNGISDPEINIANISQKMNERIQRMFDMCNAAEYIFFVFGEDQQYKFMSIDDEYFDLQDLGAIELLVKDQFSAKTFLVMASEINNARQILDMIK